MLQAYLCNVASKLDNVCVVEITAVHIALKTLYAAKKPTHVARITVSKGIL